MLNVFISNLYICPLISLRNIVQYQVIQSDVEYYWSVSV